MWGILIWLLIALVRHARKKEPGGQPASRETEPIVVVIAFRVWWLVIAVVGMVATWDLTPERSPHRSVWLTMLMFVWFPALTLRWILVPLGLVRLSAYFCLITRPVHARFDPLGAAAFHGALAAARGWAPLPAARLDFIDRRVAAVARPSGLVMVAAGLTAAIRGEVVRARELLGAGVAPRNALILPTIAAHAARDWLVADRLEVNDPDGASRMARRPGIGGWSWVVPAALSYRARPGRWPLTHVLLATPLARSGWVTLRWLRAAPQEAPGAIEPDGETPAGRAMRVLRDVLAAPDAATLRTRLPDLCQSWDALSPDNRSDDAVDAARAVAGEGVGGETGTAHVVAVDAVAAIVGHLCVVLPPLPPGDMADALRDRMSTRLLDELDIRISTLMTLEPAPTPYEVWECWRAVDHLLEAALHFDRAMAVALHGQACDLLNFALELQRSSKSRRFVAHAIWLRVEELCKRAGMSETARIARHNVEVT